VLLIPGRGRNSPNGVAVLRDCIRVWLTREPFKRVVLAFCTAETADGGPGSLYVLLRKYKKRGKIYWNRAPVDEEP
jgi:DNA-nicking Smr family endonuclease